MTIRGVLLSLLLGVAGSVLASYIYAAGIWWIVGIALTVPLVYMFAAAVVQVWKLGVVWIWPRWQGGSAIEGRLIGDCKTLFRFQTVTGRTSLNRADVEKAILTAGTVTGCEFRFLLLHPESTHLSDFCSSEGTDPKRTAQKIQDTTKALHALRDKHALTLAVRWSHNYPTWRMAVVDGVEMHLGTFAPGRKGYEGFRAVLHDRGRDSLIRPFVLAFDQAWESAVVVE